MGVNDLERSGGAALGATGMTSGLQRTLLEGTMRRLTSLRSALDHDREGSLSIERFLLLLVRACRNNTSEVRSEKELTKLAGRRRRSLGRRCLAAGPYLGVATKVVELYSETATLCELVDLHDLDLDDRDVAAHLLLLWGITDDIEAACAAVDPDQPGTIAGLAIVRARGNVTVEASRPTSLLAATKTLWGMRGAVGEMRHYTRSQSIRGWLLARKRAKRLIERAKDQLGADSALRLPAQ